MALGSSQVEIEERFSGRLQLVPAAHVPRRPRRDSVAELMPDATHLVAALDRCRERLHALPGVVGSGVGLLDAEPVVEIYVAGRGDSGLEQAIAEIADFEFVLVPDSQPAEAHASDRDTKE